MKILVTGGAGYIGSHMVRMLVGRGVDVTVIDTLDYGNRKALPDHVTLIVGNVGEKGDLGKAFSKGPFDGVIHFAGSISVEESVKHPSLYMQNNLVRPIALLEMMQDTGVKHIIFSSTAAVYGNPLHVPIPENHPKEPTNPYGLSKFYFEQFLRYVDAMGIRSISLRYFNASGGSSDGKHGEAHLPETHIIPLAIAAAMRKDGVFTLYGNSYPTSDGTCIRDYVHVEDLCTAHIAALEALVSGHKSDVYNVGTGIGVTNRQVVACVHEVSGRMIRVVEASRRAGDSHSLIADSTRIKKELNWSPQHSDIREVVESAWLWHSTHPNGYDDIS